MSIRRFFNNKTLLEDHTVRYQNGPYTVSINNDSYEIFTGELFPMDFDIEKDGKFITSIRGQDNAEKYVDQLKADDDSKYPTDIRLESYVGLLPKSYKVDVLEDEGDRTYLALYYNGSGIEVAIQCGIRLTSDSSCDIYYGVEDIDTEREINFKKTVEVDSPRKAAEALALLLTQLEPKLPDIVSKIRSGS